MSSTNESRPVIGITVGDINGIGIELIIKTLNDNRLLDICTPVIFGNNKVINFYRKTIPESNINFVNMRETARVNHKQMNLFNCWEEDVNITPGIVNEIGGKYAIKSLTIASQALKEGKIDGLVTAPIHKKNIQSAEFNFTGHTPYLKDYFKVNEVLMLLCSGNFRVALLTEHLPIKEVAQNITKELILTKLNILNASLQKDFG